MPITLRKAVSVISGVFLVAVLAVSVSDTDLGARETLADVETSPSTVHLQPLARVSSLAKKKRAAAPYLASVTTVSSSSASAYPFLDQPGITDHHKKLAAQVFGALPSSCAGHIRTFSILYKDVKYRGLGGKTTIIVDGTAPDDEFAALLTHECGHVISGNLVGSPSAGESNFHDGKDAFYADASVVNFFSISWENERTMKKGTKDADFVSGYASSDIFEDFAETFAAYVLQRPYLRQRAKANKAIAQKLAWMEQNIPLSEQALGTSTYGGSKSIPWDVTKLPYASLLSVR